MFGTSQSTTGNMTSAEQELMWVLRASAGDREALDALLRAIQAPLFRYIASLVDRRDVAEDVLQEVFLRIFRKLRWLREPQAFRAWTYRIATRESLRRLNAATPEQAVDIDELVRQVPRDGVGVPQLPPLLEKLSPASRAVIVLHYFEEFTLEEIADVLGIPRGTAKSRLAYGLMRLRQQLSTRR
jgi:RNA polymerase sigma-70 factor (ECF subfamily)